MSIVYDRYLKQHKNNVYEACKWMMNNLPKDIFPEELQSQVEYQCQYNHDKSKDSSEEYEAYDQHFYGNRSYENEKNFLYAWNHHIHNNPHHWQYWVLINDDKDEGEKLLEIPDNYIFEMICDWWSFSWNSGNLYEIFDWYEKGKDYRKINENSLKKIETILNTIKLILDTEKLEE